MTVARANRGAGFSMIEVLVTLVVLDTGLLGLAKMQAAAVSNTQIARVRSLIALQASSLASSMYSNRRYWSQGLAPTSFSAAGGVVIDATGVLSAAADCANATCTPDRLAAYDVQTWAKNLNAQFPTYTATVTCTAPGSAPVNCSINVSWSEKYVAINRSTAMAVPAMAATQTFTLHAEP